MRIRMATGAVSTGWSNMLASTERSELDRWKTKARRLGEKLFNTRKVLDVWVEMWTSQANEHLDALLALERSQEELRRHQEAHEARRLLRALRIARKKPRDLFCWPAERDRFDSAVKYARGIAEQIL